MKAQCVNVSFNTYWPESVGFFIPSRFIEQNWVICSCYFRNLVLGQGQYEECQSIHRPRVYHLPIYLAICSSPDYACFEFAVIRVGKNNKMAAKVFLSCIVTIGVNNGLAYDLIGVT